MFLTAAVQAQFKCKIDYYSTEEGLSHQAVTCMIKDHEGFMWFGSWDGINRFDGHNFVSYKSSAGDMSQLGSDRIDQIVEDQSNHLWLQAYDQQIYRFDKKSEQFFPLSRVFDGRKIRFTKILSVDNAVLWVQSEKDGLFCIAQDLSSKKYTQFHEGGTTGALLPSDHINFFHQDQQNNIWVGTEKGLAYISPLSKGMYKSFVPSGQYTEGLNFTSIEEDRSHLYLGTTSGKLVCYNKLTKDFSVLYQGSSRINYLLHSRLNRIYATTDAGELVIINTDNHSSQVVKYNIASPLYTIYEDRSANLWIEPYKTGVIRFDPNSQQFSSFDQKAEQHFLLNFGNRFKVFEDNSGLLWINMKGGGFGYFNTSTNKIETTITTADFPKYSLPKVVFNIFYDPTGVMWLRIDERRLMKIIFQANDFKQQLLVNPGKFYTDNEVRGILSDRQGKLWLGVKSGRLYVYQKGKLLTDLFDNEPKGGLGLVYTLLQDSHGNIWMGTKSEGIYKATPVNAGQTKYHLTHFTANQQQPVGLTSNQIYSLLEDRQGRIWVGSFDDGLFLVKEINSNINFIHTGPLLTSSQGQNFQKIRHMCLDEHGNIWLATTDGLVIMDATDKQDKFSFKTYTKIAGDKNSLGNNNIQFICRDTKNRMWLATSGGGLDLAIGANPLKALDFSNFTTKDGLPNDYLLSCTEDHTGNLWIATENGLSKFSPTAKSFRNYDSYDGLPQAGFSEASVTKLPDGEIVYGTTNGFISFTPESIGIHRMPGNIVFSGLQVNNVDVSPSISNKISADNINYTGELKLKHDQNIITIDYSILDYRSTKQAFAYRLKGFDNSWHSDRQFRRVTYTNLPPGNYVFEVKSLSTDLYSNMPYRRLAITILPPFWKTWWAYLIYVVLAVVLIEIIRRTVTTMIRLRNKIAVEQKVAELKLRFFTNVSHELRTPLTLIMNPLEQLFTKEKLSPQGTAWVEVAHKNASRMIRFINQLLDIRKLQTNTAKSNVSRVEILGFIKRISEHFEDAIQNNNVKLQVQCEQKQLFFTTDAEKLDVIVYNLLSNAVKFSPLHKSIILRVKQQEGQRIHISITDEGPGVDKEKLEEIFELYYEGDLNSQKGLKGTGIGLALAKELVEFLGGKIWATNNEDGGLTVHLEIKELPSNTEQQANNFTIGSQDKLEKTIEQKLLKSYSPTQQCNDKEAPLVLLVEDNRELNEFLKRQLSEFYRVEVALDGQEGFDKALNLSPDLVISDIMMPVMNGIQMLEKLKKQQETSHIPVVLLTAKHSVESQLEGLSYGADAYITKPFNNRLLIASINNLLTQRKLLFEGMVQKKKVVDLRPGEVIITSKDETFLKEVIKAVEEKMSDPDFNIETIAEAIRMSRTIFYKKFKSLANLTPVEFVREMRLQRAKQLLDAGGSNISEIAYEVGFNNPKYFTTCFKEKYQVTPSDYQKGSVNSNS